MCTLSGVWQPFAISLHRCGGGFDGAGIVGGGGRFAGAGGRLLLIDIVSEFWISNFRFAPSLHPTRLKDFSPKRGERLNDRMVKVKARTSQDMDGALPH